MDVTRWKTPVAFFPWHHVQKYIDCIDSTVYHVTIAFAQEQLLDLAKAWPPCGTPAAELCGFSVADPEAAWDAGTGRVGFLTVCKGCRLQVDFLIDPVLSEMQAELWRECRTLN